MLLSKNRSRPSDGIYETSHRKERGMTATQAVRPTDVETRMRANVQGLVKEYWGHVADENVARGHLAAQVALGKITRALTTYERVAGHPYPHRSDLIDLPLT